MWLKCTQLGKSKTWGKCVLRNRNTKYNMKGKNIGIYTTRTTGDINKGGGT